MCVAVNGCVVFIESDVATCRIIVTDAEDRTLVGVSAVILHPLPCHSVVATRKTIRCSYFKIVDPCDIVAEPVFL